MRRCPRQFFEDEHEDDDETDFLGKEEKAMTATHIRRPLMLKRTILAFLILTSLATAADKYTELQGLGPLPEYVVKSTKEKIVVDGKLSDSAWSQITPITLMFPWDFQTGKKQK